jgi:energy-coupling factor transport system ATP-binding protein
VISGLSGCGKTTLCHILSGIIPNAIKGRISGDVSVMHIHPPSIDLPKASLVVGMVFQDADSQIVCTTVEDEVAFGLENLCMPPEDIKLRVDMLLKEFGLDGYRYANPSSLSGGQKKLLNIASVLAPAPSVLILDEPMSGLDEEGRVLVRDAICRQRDLGRTVILVEHDLKHAAFADRYLILRDGAAAVCDTLGDSNGEP